MTLDFSDSTFDVAQGVNTGDITVDSALSSSSTNPVQNKVLYPSCSGFIPADTTFYVNSGGTKDFTTVEDAISYLTGKWSNGNVIIEIEAGTYTPASRIEVNTRKFNIPCLKINGAGQSNVTVKRGFYILGCYSCRVLLGGLKIEGVTGTESLVEAQDTQVYLYSISFNNGKNSVYATSGATIRVGSSTHTSITDNAIFANMGSNIQADGTLTCTNVNYAVYVNWGSQISLYGVTKAFTSVSHDTNQTLNTLTNNGFITGGWNS